MRKARWWRRSRHTNLQMFSQHSGLDQRGHAHTSYRPQYLKQEEEGHRGNGEDLFPDKTTKVWSGESIRCSGRWTSYSRPTTSRYTGYMHSRYSLGFIDAGLASGSWAHFAARLVSCLERDLGFQEGWFGLSNEGFLEGCLWSQGAFQTPASQGNHH